MPELQNIEYKSQWHENIANRFITLLMLSNLELLTEEGQYNYAAYL